MRMKTVILSAATLLILTMSTAAQTSITRVGGWTTGLTHTAGAGSNRLLIFDLGYENNQGDSYHNHQRHDVLVFEHVFLEALECRAKRGHTCKLLALVLK